VLKTVLHELKHHLPFTVFSAVGAMVIIAFLTIVMSATTTTQPQSHSASESSKNSVSNNSVTHEHEQLENESTHYFYDLFHVFHPFHILFSAAATTAMFWRFDRKLLKAISIGLLGALAICAASDIYLPFIGGSIVGATISLHVCIVEHILLVVPFALIGVVIGLISCETFIGRRSTIFSHTAHVFISTMATILYLVAFGFTNWMSELFTVFIIIVAAVFIPCCISDIVFPLSIVTEKVPKIECNHRSG
jgi:hypothetical protein